MAPPRAIPKLDYASIDTSKWKNIPNPPGYVDSASKKGAKPSDQSIAKGAFASSQLALKQQRAWDLAMAPGKSLPMNAFMLYMSGGGVQIFSIGILAMLLINPIKAFANINTAFAPLEPTPAEGGGTGTLIPQKAVYVLCNLLTLALGLWKCSTLGLLPTGTADWLAFETRGLAPEISLL